MKRSRHPRVEPVAIAMAIVALLAGCASTPPDPRLAALSGQLAALKADPRVVQTAPAELAAAETAVAEAQHASGDPLHRQRLLRIAELRLRIARAAAKAVAEERAYERLRANAVTHRGGAALASSPNPGHSPP